jgi:hypothetical protein
MLFLTLLLVGIIFLVAHAVQERQRRLNARVKLLTGDEQDLDLKPGEQVVYRYLPRDLDDFYRSDVTIPSKLYGDMFTQNQDALRIR